MFRTIWSYIGENRRLKAENKKLKGHWEEAEGRVILSESQNYCMICGNTLDGYIPPREHKGD